MRLVLVRHGETAWNAEGKFQGQSPVGLNEKGLSQARQIARAITPMRPTALYSSPLPRTRMTAEEISREAGIQVQPLEGIQEADLGELEGITGEEMRASYSHVYAAWRENPAEVVFPGGESMRQLRERAWRAMEQIRRAHADGLVVVVSHNFAIRSILCRFLGLRPSGFQRLRVDLGSISILQSDAGSRHVLTINDTCHLSPD